MFSRKAALLAVILAPAAFLLAQSGNVIGTEMAPVKIEVFSDFECPHCKLLHESTIKELKSDLVQKGRVQLISRDFPLPNHSHAREAAYLAVAAGRIGKREVVADELFRTQQEWSQTGQMDAVVQKVLPPADFKKVKALAHDAKVMAQVESDIALGKQNNLTQTPTMVITAKGKHTPVAGNISYAILKRYLDTLF